MKRSSGIISHDKYLQKLFEEDAKIAKKDSDYQKYLTSLTTLLATTNKIYDNGGMLEPKDYDDLMSQYLDAVQKGIDYRDSKGSKARKNVVEYINKILSKDLKALRDADRNKLKYIDDIFSVSRTVKVKVPQELTHKVGGEMSERFPMKSKTGKRGFFTSRTDTANEAKWEQLFKKIEATGLTSKQMKKFNKLKNDHGLRRDLMNALGYASSNLFAQSVAAAVELGFYPNEEVADDELLKEENQKLLSGLNVLVEDGAKLISVYNMQMRLGYDPYTRNDNKNAAMYEVAKLLGCEKLIAKAVPMEVSNGDQVLKGTFMENAEGSDIFNMKGDDELLAYRKAYGPYNKDLYRDLANLQVLDYICGNVDRHEGNMLYKTTRENGRLKINGLVGIDNDASFPERDFYEQEFQFHDEEYPHIFKPENFRYVNRETADIIRNMNRAQLESVLRGHNISKEAIDRAWNRTLEVKNVLEKMSEKNIQYVDEIIDGKTNPSDPQNPFYITDDIKKNPSIFSGFDHRIEREIDREKMKDSDLQRNRKMNDELLIANDDGAELKAFKDQKYEERQANAAEYKDATRQQALLMDFKKIEKMNSIMKRINRMKSPSKEFIQMRDAMNTIAEHVKSLKVSVSLGDILHGTDYETYKEELNKLNAATKNYINEKGASPRTEAGKERLKGAMSLDNKISDLLISFEAGKNLETPELDNAVRENNYLDEVDEHLL